jgi:hypothetical protein
LDRRGRARVLDCAFGYLPRALGAVPILGGASFIAENVLIVLAPEYNLPYVMMPMFLAMASMALWLPIKGVDRARWDAMRRCSLLDDGRAHGHASRAPDC